MADISKIKLPNNQEYNLKDNDARKVVKQSLAGGYFTYPLLASNQSSPVSGNNYETIYDDNITINPGKHSIAEGYDTQASGTASHAEGYGTTASGSASHAEGDSTTASWNDAHAEGCQTVASKWHAHAEGLKSVSSGEASHAEGYNTSSEARGSHSEGYSTRATGIASHAEGISTYHFANTSKTIKVSKVPSNVPNVGQQDGKYYITIGGKKYFYLAYANAGEIGEAMGIPDNLQGCTIKFTYDSTEYSAKVVQVVGTGAGGADDAFAFSVDDYTEFNEFIDNATDFAHAETVTIEYPERYGQASGDASHVEGYDTIASGDYSHAEGEFTNATGRGGHAEGIQTFAGGSGSHAEGEFTNATGDDAHAEGYGTTASGDYSHAEGIRTIALGKGSHAEGYTEFDGSIKATSNGAHAGGYARSGSIEAAEVGSFVHGWVQGGIIKATSKGSHAEGYCKSNYKNGNITASGEGSHAEGYSTGQARPSDSLHIVSANGKGAHAEGMDTSSTADGAHAEGIQTFAGGTGSHAEGYSTGATGEASHAEGRYTTTLNTAEHAEGKYNRSNGSVEIDYVDLGLSVKWAAYNLGATAPEGVGKYYQWGSITDVENISCSWSTCPHTNGTYSSSNKKVFTKYVPTSSQAEYWGGEGDADNLTVIQTVDDAAQIKYNPKWRIPTERDFRTLLNNTTQTIETIGTTKGIRFTSTVEGYTDKSIFIPYSGEKTDNNYINVNTNAFIWASTLLSDAPNAAFAFNLTDSTILNTTRSRYIGMNIRPVFDDSVQDIKKTIHSIGIGTSENNRKNAIEVLDNGDVYVNGLGNYDGTTVYGALKLQEVINGKQNALTAGDNISIDNTNTISANIKPFLVEITYSNLVALRNNGLLIKGQQYRIIDYETTTIQSDTDSAGNNFDIIVVADDAHTLNENVRAIKNSNDEYFSSLNSNLSAWELKYCLDNDTNRFTWADDNGKGVIWYMKDEYNNECYYDFKNIRFEGEYTFNHWDGSENLDYSTWSIGVTGYYNYCCSNKIGICYNDGIQCIPRNIFRNEGGICSCNILGTNCFDNEFGDGCHHNKIGAGCDGNRFGDYWYSNSLGDNCIMNDFTNNYVRYCTFGNNIYQCELSGNSTSEGSEIQYVHVLSGTNGTAITILSIPSDDVTVFGYSSQHGYYACNLMYKLLSI